MKSVLLIGRVYHLLFAFPPLLRRAGFDIDLVCSSLEMKKCRFIRSYSYVPENESFFPKLASIDIGRYDWIIPTDEGTLNDIVKADGPMAKKLKLLPILTASNLAHICSKAGLSETLSQHGIPTPPFNIALTSEDAVILSNEIGYPVLLKQDYSSGGWGIRECGSAEEIIAIQPDFFSQKIVVQKKISGKDLDLSALFLEGELIHFSYAIQEKTCHHRFGPSSLRTYTPLQYVEKNVFQELAQLGKALGLHGFCNILAIQNENGERYYVEADARPNVWVDHTRYIGDDIATQIRAWFSDKIFLTYPVRTSLNQPVHKVIPYFQRLKLWELLINRYSVWKYIPYHSSRIFLDAFFRGITRKLLHSVKKYIPEKYHPFCKKIKRSIKVFLCKKTVEKHS